MPSRPPHPHPCCPAHSGTREGRQCGRGGHWLAFIQQSHRHPLSWGIGGRRGADPLNTLGIPSAPHLLGWQSLVESPGYQGGLEAQRGGQDLVRVLGVQHG